LNEADALLILPAALFIALLVAVLVILSKR
jgi:hypothetical protein